jgi:glyoxylase-like metal-dependent hydrolase (beta-lactamase superfamily II)
VLIAGFPAGPWGTNCYVVASGPGQECVVVDPGKDAMSGIDEVVRENRLMPAAVLLTHGHIDHVWSVVPVCESRGIPAYLHPADRPMLADPLSGLSAQTRAAMNEMTGGRLPATEPDEVLDLGDGQVLELVGLEFTVDHAPGHTKGSVMFRTPGGLQIDPVCFSGDVLFEGSIGRTDLPGGDHASMLRSLVAKVLPLADATVVLPGHGAQTTIERERSTNPYLLEVSKGLSVDVTRTGL